MNRKLTARLLHLFCKLVLRPGKLGRLSFVAPPFRIPGAQALYMGDNTRIGPYAFFVLVHEHLGKHYSPEFTIGNNVHIGHDFFGGCQKRIIIEDNVLISSRVFMSDAIHDYRDVKRPVLTQPLTTAKTVIVQESAFIGVNASILPGVTIGRNAVVAASAVVTKDVPSYSVVAGNPASVIKQYAFETGTWVKKARGDIQ